MRKKLTAALLGAALVFGIAGAGVSRVSAEPEEQTEEAAEQEASEADEPEESTDSEETVPESGSEETDEPEKSSESPETADIESEEIQDTETEENSEQELTGMIIYLENELESSITSIEISTFAGETCSDNLLAEDSLLSAGDSVTVGIPEEFQDPELGMYNVRILQEDGTAAEIPFVPLLEQVTGTIYRDGDNILIRVRDERLEAEEEQVSVTEIMETEAEVSEMMSDALAAEVE